MKKKKKTFLTLACTWSLAIHVIVVSFKGTQIQALQKFFNVINRRGSSFFRTCSFPSERAIQVQKTRKKLQIHWNIFLVDDLGPIKKPKFAALNSASSRNVVAISDRFKFGGGVIPQIPDVSTCQ